MSLLVINLGNEKERTFICDLIQSRAKFSIAGIYTGSSETSGPYDLDYELDTKTLTQVTFLDQLQVYLCHKVVPFLIFKFHFFVISLYSNFVLPNKRS